MIHIRDKILTELVNILKNNTFAKDKVYSNRLQNISEKDLPAIVIYINNEEATRETMTRPCMLKKEINLSIEILASLDPIIDLDKDSDELCFILNSTIDEQINQIAGEIEIILANNYKIGDLVIDTKYTNFEMNLSNESASQTGIAKMSYLITYRCLDNEPFI